MRSVVLVGAGGTGMSGVASMLWKLWLDNIVCIDATQSQLTDRLRSKGINVVIGHGKYEIQKTDIVVYSEACVDSIEVVSAKNMESDVKTPAMVWSYFQFLWELSKYFKTIGIAWTNGKSTTTSLFLYTAKKYLKNLWLGILGALVPDLWWESFWVSDDAKEDVANILLSIFSNQEIQDFDILKKHYFVVEACEYKEHFLYLDIDELIVLNANLDHTDYFEDLSMYQDAFLKLARKVSYNIFVLNGEESCQFLSSDYDIKSKLIKVNRHDFEFDYLFWVHQSINGSVVLAVLKKVWIMENELILKKYMQEFRWLWRRMECLGKTEFGAIFYSDYGHVAESIDLGWHALKNKFPTKKIVCVFQPHQMKRVVVWRDAFVKAMNLYDDVMIYDIYAARESVSDVADWCWNNPVLQNVVSVEDLWQRFAVAVGGEYVQEFDKLRDGILLFDDRFVVVFFSAGDLDYLVRGRLEL